MDGGCTGANGTNPIASLRSRNTSFATLHSAQKEYSTYSVTLWIGSISTRGLSYGLTPPEWVPQELSPTEPETKCVMVESIVTTKVPAKGATF